MDCQWHTGLRYIECSIDLRAIDGRSPANPDQEVRYRLQSQMMVARRFAVKFTGSVGLLGALLFSMPHDWEQMLFL